MAHGFVVDVYEPDWLKTALIDRGWSEVALEGHRPGADLAWITEQGKTLGIQRKTISDLLTSWWDGRLQEQLANLCAGCDIPVLLVEGSPGITKDDAKTFKWVKGKSTPVIVPRGTLTCDGKPVTRNLKLKHEPVKYQTFEAILAELTGNRPSGIKFDLVLVPGWQEYVIWNLTEYLPARYDSEEFSGWVRLQKGETHENPQVQALLGVRGMGAKRATELLAHFGGPWDVIQAVRQGRLLEKKKPVVAGVGPSLVKKLQEVWGTDDAS